MDTSSDIDTPPEGSGGERIAKRLARAGLCSRRDAERWIAEGRVAVNGTTLDSPAFVVKPGDEVIVDGKPVPEPEPTRLWRYHKPAGLVTTARDEKGRATVFDKLPADLPRVVSVGRLDLTTEGLLLLTNDGELARFLELPATGWTRRYRVRVHGAVDEARLAGLIKGVVIDGVQYGPIEAILDRVQGSNAWLTVAIKEGKNREIRKVMESLELTVNRLIRTAYGPFQLGKLPEGEVEEVPKRVVKDQISGFFAQRDGAPEEPKSAGGTAKAAPRASNRGPHKAGPKPEPKPDNSPIRAPKARPKPAVRAVEADEEFVDVVERPSRRFDVRTGKPVAGKPVAGAPARRSEERADRPSGKAKPPIRSAARAPADAEERGSRSPERPRGGRPAAERPVGERPVKPARRPDERGERGFAKTGGKAAGGPSAEKPAGAARGRPQGERTGKPGGKPERAGPGQGAPKRGGGPREGGPREGGPRGGRGGAGGGGRADRRR